MRFKTVRKILFNLNLLNVTGRGASKTPRSKIEPLAFSLMGAAILSLSAYFWVGQSQTLQFGILGLMLGLLIYQALLVVQDVYVGRAGKTLQTWLNNRNTFGYLQKYVSEQPLDAISERLNTLTLGYIDLAYRLEGQWSKANRQNREDINLALRAINDTPNPYTRIIEDLQMPLGELTASSIEILEEAENTLKFLQLVHLNLQGKNQPSLTFEPVKP